MIRTLLLHVALSLSVATLAQFSNDAAILDYVGLKYPCGGEVVPMLRIQNQGTSTMATCVVETWKNGLFNNSFNWVLAVPAVTSATRQPLLPVIGGLADGDVVQFRIIDVNGVPDQDTTGNTLSVQLGLQPVIATSYVVMIEVLTDNVPGETTWSLRNDQAQVVAQGGPYAMAADTSRIWVTLDPASCTQLEVNDAGGDGFAGGYVKVYDLGSPLIDVDGANFTDQEVVGLVPGQVMSVDERHVGRSDMRFFPSPGDGLVTVVFPAATRQDRLFQLMDAMGRSVEERVVTVDADMSSVLDVSHLSNGVYFARAISMDGSVLQGSFVVKH